MARKKATGSNGRDSAAKRRGVKKYGGERVPVRATSWYDKLGHISSPVSMLAWARISRSTLSWMAW